MTGLRPDANFWRAQHKSCRADRSEISERIVLVGECKRDLGVAGKEQRSGVKAVSRGIAASTCVLPQDLYSLSNWGSVEAIVTSSYSHQLWRAFTCTMTQLMSHKVRLERSPDCLGLG